MPAGAPRTVSLEPSEMIELGKEMVEWLSNHPEALHISAWYSIEKGISESAWETMIRREEFVGYYDIARRIVGLKYLDKDSKVRDSISHRWQRIYFKDLKQEEDDKLRFEAELKKMNLDDAKSLLINIIDYHDKKKSDP